MLCSDGLTEMVPIQAISDVLQSANNPRSACERLVALANENGGKDNITVIVVHCDAPAESSTPTKLATETRLKKEVPTQN